jgi:hypothetical protein
MPRQPKKLTTWCRPYPQVLTRHDDDFLFWRNGTKMPVSMPDEQKPYEVYRVAR